MEVGGVWNRIVHPGRSRGRTSGGSREPGSGGEAAAKPPAMVPKPDALAALIRLTGRPLVIADVGCRWGLANAWERYGRHAQVVGFDPDAEECARLERAYSGSCEVRYVPVGLGRRRRRSTLYQTVEPACSSLYPPDHRAMNRHPDLERVIRPVGTTRIATTTLDAWWRGSKLDPIDFLKLDTQGSELDILRGARRQLDAIRFVEVEVEFNPIYRAQPLFPDVDRFLRRRGFVLWRLTNLVHYGLRDAPGDRVEADHMYFDSVPSEVQTRGGQLTWGHAYFVRREVVDGEVDNWVSCVKDACIASSLGFHDLASRSLTQGFARPPAQVVREMHDALDA